MRRVAHERHQAPAVIPPVPLQARVPVRHAAVVHLLVVVGADGVFRAVNPAWTAILGHAPAEVVGRSFLDFVWPDDAAPTQGGLDTAASAEAARVRSAWSSFRSSCAWVQVDRGSMPAGFDRYVAENDEEA